ncbi:MAG: ParB/RepB/Spo0J family partition protein, partial [Oligoflexales bacterium]|nr:ParB/RepB/Spo0J family partition protein [Oligoflexales bacterium]
SLLGDIDLDQTNEATIKAVNSGMVKFVNINEVIVNPRQPRKFFDEKKLKELSQSIAMDGILQPLVVKKQSENEGYLLVAGERRLRASKLAGLTEVPVIIKDFSDKDLLRLALIENIQRSDLNVIEEAQAIKTLIEDLNLSQEDCASKLGKDRSTIANLLRLLVLPQNIQNDVVENKITMGHARALLSLKNEIEISRARDLIVKNNLNVRQTEQLCKKVSSGSKSLVSIKSSGTEKANPNIDYLAEKIRNHLRTKVKLSGSASRGKIIISYFSIAELERITEILS